eukprot:gb/GFBE01067280.1/.p1 GENE.gb/GFBE01067280.1/~~gb/GFBE01067280.1/.p1  ORF type:complete len:207 (+),score=10.15 gb/GFBE01067280.1/:1-621(+)
MLSRLGYVPPPQKPVHVESPHIEDDAPSSPALSCCDAERELPLTPDSPASRQVSTECSSAGDMQLSARVSSNEAYSHQVAKELHCAVPQTTPVERSRRNTISFGHQWLRKIRAALPALPGNLRVKRIGSCYSCPPESPGTVPQHRGGGRAPEDKVPAARPRSPPKSLKESSALGNRRGLNISIDVPNRAFRPARLVNGRRISVNSC